MALSLAFAAATQADPVSFDDWRAEFFSPSQLADLLISGPAADSDNDQSTNFAEYVFRTNPWMPQTEPILSPGFTIDPSTGLLYFSATFRVTLETEGALLVPQVTEHLGTRWRADQIELRGNGYIADGRYEYLAVDRQSADLPEHRFIRLLIAADADQDGMPDDWELGLGLSPSDPFDSMADSDEDGDGNLAEFLHGTNPFDPNDNLRRDDVPRAPRNVRIENNSDGTRDVLWDDVSDNEEFFVIYSTDANGNTVEIGRLGPNQTRFRIPTGY